MKIFNTAFIFVLVFSNIAFGIELKPVSINNKKPTTKDLLQIHLELVSYRHKVLSDNIANLNTPGYEAKEVSMPTTLSDLAAAGNGGYKKIAMRLTSYKHISGHANADNKFSSHKLKDPLERKKNGNTVSLAQQINKISQNQSAYDTSLKISASSNSLISTVLGK
jgi:flagellar basal-body rod protein FlgB